MAFLTSVFGQPPSITAGQELARTIVVLIYSIAAFRLSGRRTFARWSAPDLVVSMVAGSSLSRAMTGNAALGGTLAAVSLLILIHWAIAKMTARSQIASRIFEGSAVELAAHGTVHRLALRTNNISRTDLEEAVRQSGFDDIHQPAWMMLEPSGKISVARQNASA
jgi:uncharacterized membrane protein YcaP (DUF421 family)